MAADNVVLEHLRAIRATQDRHTEMLLELQSRVGVFEQQYANLSARVDRIDNRTDRIELVEG